MSYNYSNYASDDNDKTSGDSGNSGSGGSGGDDVKIKMVPHAAVEGELTKVFGNRNSFGDSLGLVWEGLEVVDGCLYKDEKDTHKVFPWKEVVGIDPEEAEDLTADDANQYLVKNYPTGEKRYELVAAVVPEVDEPYEVGDVIMWYGGDKGSGPKPASVTLAKILTKYGNEAVVSKTDDEWLVDTSKNDILRADLQGRRLAFFEVKKESNKTGRTFHHPVVIDTTTGSAVRVQNGGEQADTAPAADGADEAEVAADGGPEVAEGDTPEPIEDFISTCESLNFTDRDRAETLLSDLVADEGNDLTADMVDGFGGEGAVLDLVAN